MFENPMQCPILELCRARGEDSPDGLKVRVRHGGLLVRSGPPPPHLRELRGDTSCGHVVMWSRGKCPVSGVAGEDMRPELVQSTVGGQRFLGNEQAFHCEQSFSYIQIQLLHRCV